MTNCPNCRDLVGQSADVDPPDEMRALTQYFTSNGIVETYRCRSCGSQWQRTVATGMESGPWKNLGGYRQAVRER